MTLRLYQVVLPVTDINQAADFYGHLFDAPGKRVSPGRHQFDLNGLIFCCWDFAKETKTSGVLPHSQRVDFSVDDLDSAFQRANVPQATLFDEQIAVFPWGERFFRLKDPFGNQLTFLDETTLQRQQEERSAAGPDEAVRVGTALSIQLLQPSPQKQLVASVERIFHVEKVFDEEIWLKLTQVPADFPFKEADQIRIHFWKDGIPHFSDVSIVKLDPSNNQYISITVPTEATPLQRRAAPRIRIQLPLSYRVETAKQTDLMTGDTLDSHTLDLSVGGLRFETPISLQKGDQVQVNLTLPTGEVSTLAQVVSADRINWEGQELSSVGGQFVDLKLDDQIKILQFLIDAQENTPGEDAPSAAG